LELIDQYKIKRIYTNWFIFKNQ